MKRESLKGDCEAQVEVGGLKSSMVGPAPGEKWIAGTVGTSGLSFLA